MESPRKALVFMEILPSTLNPKPLNTPPYTYILTQLPCNFACSVPSDFIGLGLPKSSHCPLEVHFIFNLILQKKGNSVFFLRCPKPNGLNPKSPTP